MDWILSSKLITETKRTKYLKKHNFLKHIPNTLKKKKKRLLKRNIFLIPETSLSGNIGGVSLTKKHILIILSSCLIFKKITHMYIY